MAMIMIGLVLLITLFAGFSLGKRRIMTATSEETMQALGGPPERKTHDVGMQTCIVIHPRYEDLLLIDLQRLVVRRGLRAAKLKRDVIAQLAWHDAEAGQRGATIDGAHVCQDLRTVFM